MQKKQTTKDTQIQKRQLNRRLILALDVNNLFRQDSVCTNYDIYHYISQK